jgi:hypothetical protein
MKSLLFVAMIFINSVWGGALALADESTYTIPLTDDAPSDCPLKASGRFVVYEVMLQDSMKISWSFNILISNIGPKDILAYEAEIDATPEHGLPLDQINRPDFFFDRAIMKSGGERTLRLEPGPTTEFGYNPSIQEPHTPNASFTVSFIEFADGTTYGKSKWGQSLPEARRAFLIQLQKLEESYKTGGGTALKNSLDLALTRLDLPQPTLFQLESLKSTLNEGGEAAFAARVEEARAAAKEHGLGFTDL